MPVSYSRSHLGSGRLFKGIPPSSLFILELPQGLNSILPYTIQGHSLTVRFVMPFVCCSCIPLFGTNHCGDTITVVLVYL